jgi:hypothetical protein
MTIEQKLTNIQKLLNLRGILKASGIHQENWKPHPFMVSKKHLKEKDKNEGVLTEEILEKYKCGNKNCKLKYSQHKSDDQLILQLKKDAFESEIHKDLQDILPLIKEYNIKTIAFAESEEKYKFLKDE